MRTLKDQIKSISLFLATLILFQSCATYKTPLTLEQAVQEQKEVKIVTVDDDAYKYKYIVYENGQFYGVKDNPGEDVKFPISTEEVAEVLMKKKGIPTWVWITLGVAVIVAFIVIITMPNFDFFGDPEWRRIDDTY